MSIRFTCDFCSRKYRVDDNLAGRKVKCKECGTELQIPDPAAAVSASSIPAHDLYGLDDGDEAEAPPMPRRPGRIAEPSGTRRTSKKRSVPQNTSQLRKSGNSLLVFGVGIFVLPLVGLQWAVINVLPIGAQLGLGLVMIAAGAFCHLSASLGVVKGLLFSVLGGLAAIGGLFVVLVVTGLAVGQGRNPGQQVAVKPPKIGNRFIAPKPPDIPVPDQNDDTEVQPEPEPAATDDPPASTPQPTENVDPQGPIKVTLTQGEAAPSEMGGMGIAVRLSYQIQTRLPGPLGLDLCLKCRKGRVKIVPTLHLRGNGQITIAVPSLHKEDGPFEATFESQDPSAAGMAVDTIPLGWTDQAFPADRPRGLTPNHGPPRGSMGPRGSSGPRFGPRGRP